MSFCFGFRLALAEDHRQREQEQDDAARDLERQDRHAHRVEHRFADDDEKQQDAARRPARGPRAMLAAIGVGGWPRVAEMNTGTVPIGSITAHRSTKLLRMVWSRSWEYVGSNASLLVTGGPRTQSSVAISYHSCHWCCVTT